MISLCTKSCKMEDSCSMSNLHSQKKVIMIWSRSSTSNLVNYTLTKQRQAYSTQFSSEFEPACLYKYNGNTFGRVW